MPRNKRDTMKREMASGLNHLVDAQEMVGRLYTRFEGVHNDYASLLLLIGQSMNVTSVLMRKFWLLAWGKLPDDVRSYMA